MNTAIKLLVATGLLVCAPLASAYEFAISNTADTAITTLQFSSDGNTWRDLALDGGYAAGYKGALEWEAADLPTQCEWQIRAVFADKSESKPLSVDLCKSGVEVQISR